MISAHRSPANLNKSKAYSALTVPTLKAMCPLFDTPQVYQCNEIELFI